MDTTDHLPITETLHPASAGEIVEVIKHAIDSQHPVYPIGGATSLDFGLPARDAGLGMAFDRLNSVVDYPARDMTITVQAGITMSQLNGILAGEGQRIPLDVPQSNQATLGGVISTNFSGPRRYGLGTARDYVIGIKAVDGHGTPFAGGGRVVKNVAGYDFCKLLTGSMGTLAIITEVTLKLIPVVEATALVVCAPRDWDHTDQILSSLVTSAAHPTAIEWLTGPRWHATTAWSGQTASDDAGLLMIGMEGTAVEVDWMVTRIGDELRQLAVEDHRVWTNEQAEPIWNELAEFPANSESPLVLKINVLPSRMRGVVQAAREINPNCSIQAHAGNGILIVRLSEFPNAGALTGVLQPAAVAALGNAIVLSSPGGEMTRQCVWGGIGTPFWMMRRVKAQFDPHDLLNRGRFVY